MRLYTRTGSDYWYAEIQVRGKPTRISTGVLNDERLRESARDAAEIQQQKRNRSVGLTLDRAFETYIGLCYGRLRDSSLDIYGKVLAKIGVMYPETRLSDVTPPWIRTHITKRREMGISDISIRRELHIMSGMMDHAIEGAWDGAPEFNPFRVVTKKTLKKAVSRPRPLTPEQVQRLLAAMPPMLNLFAQLVLETGMRRGEAIGLNWGEVDIRKGIINLPGHRTKTGKPRTIPLSDAALELLRGIVPYPGSPYVFTSKRTGKCYHATGFNHTWLRVRKRAGVPHARIHDLRHTFASWTRQSGMARDDRMSVVGHTSEEVHTGYSQTTITALREAMNRHSPSTFLAQHTESPPQEGTSTS